MRLRDVLFQKKVVIQSLNRVALKPELLENLGLKVGDEVSIFLDTRKKEIIIRGDD
jgi:bifunctional DNA-binding transcriptional regulator/antitoxin component of YhaV-PrlF toxin-antitoxin module